MTRRAAQLTAVLVLLVAASGTAVAVTCTPSQGVAAEEAVDHLDTWAQIYRAYRQFSICDDGVVAEGFSDRVVHLLGTKLEQLRELNQYIRAHPGFGTFVVRHVDATTDTDELKKIEKLAASQCPGKLGRLCADLRHAAESAINEASK